jgi:acetyl esterase/lipase
MVHRLYLTLLPALLLAQPQVPDWVSVEPNISYSTHKETVLDIFQSKRSTGNSKRPAVIVIHGGGWVGGKKEDVFNRYCLPFLEKGFVVANVEYRLAGVAPAPAAVEDSLLAAKWLRDNAAKYGIDRKKIVATGGSAGGHLALMVGLSTKKTKLGPVTKIAAVVNFYGITDVQDQLEGQNMRDYAVKWVPTSVPDRQELARRVSPVSWVRKKAPPVITIHGDADETVPYEHGVDFTKELRNAGGDAEMIPVRQGGHGNFTPQEFAEIYAQIFYFLERRKIL